jgi:hypothetical protein
MRHPISAIPARKRPLWGKRWKHGLWLGGLCLLVTVPAAAEDDGGAPGAFLRFGSSARSLAVGNAVCGVADDVATASWNPAGLAQLRTMELMAMGASLFADTRYTFFALGLPTERFGTLAFSGSVISSGEFERATWDQDLAESFSEKEGVFALSYARGGGRLAWGVSLKSVSQNIGGSRGSSLGADLGIFFRPHRHLSFGAACQNALAPEITLEEEAEKLARSLRGGAALRFFNNRLLVISDLVKTEYMDAGLQSGVEMWPVRNAGLRAGYDSSKEQLSFGIGLRWESWQFDYAFIDHDLGSANILSATLRFGVPYGVKVHRDRDLFSPSGSEREVTFAVATAIRGQVESWQLVIADAEGRGVRRLEGNGPPPAEITWNGADDQGRLVGDGTYEARMVILDDLGQTWDYQTSVEVLGFRDRTRVPIRVEISGSGHSPTEGENR